MQTNPFDQLLRASEGRPIVPESLGLTFPSAPIDPPEATHHGKTGITTRLFGLLSVHGAMTTRELADAAGLEQSKLIWGLMKLPLKRGQVTYSDSRWRLSTACEAQLQHDINQAVQLLRKHGWTCIASPQDKGDTK